jgi:hypothetical protein
MVLAIAVGALDRFLHWMNQASDFSLYAGLLGVTCLVVVVPAALAVIWRRLGVSRR